MTLSESSAHLRRVGEMSIPSRSISQSALSSGSSSTRLPISSSETIEAAAWEIAQPWPWKRRSATLPSSTTHVHAELVAAQRVVVVPLEVVGLERPEVPRVLVVVEDVVAVEGVH